MAQDPEQAFITRHQLRMEKHPVDVVQGMLPPGYPVKEINDITFVTREDQETFGLPCGKLHTTVSDALSWVRYFAQDGAETSYEAWVEKHYDLAMALNEQAKAHYTYCRDMCIRMKRLLGKEEFEIFMHLGDMS